MLARVVRSAAVQQSAKRAISSSAAVAKSLQLHPVTSVSITPPPPAVAATVSSGELAWCEIYGLDYEQQVQEALDESPLLVKDAQQATPALARAPSGSVARAPRAAATTAKGDIWNVVFGATA